MSDRINIESVPNITFIEEGHDIGQIVLQSMSKAGMSFEENDILCIASKAVSSAEGKLVKLEDIQVSEQAKEIQAKIPRKDERVVQAIINATGDPSGGRIELDTNYIAGWLPNGMRLTSAGVDKIGTEAVILLPDNPDKSAHAIGQTILETTGINVGVIITDSDGRVEKRGSTQLAIGLYGVPALRISQTKEGGKVRVSEETTCDMLAASAALLMGQRGTNKPAVLIRGFEYEFNPTSTIVDSLSRPTSAS